MSLTAPAWLLLGVALVIAARLFGGLELARPLRALALCSLVTALAGPACEQRGGGLDLWVLVDRSDSAAQVVGEELGAWKAILREGRGAQDRLRWVPFARDALVEAEGAPIRFEGRTDGTRIGLALRTVASGLDPTRASRVLVLTDGHGTDDLGGLSRLFEQAEVPVDVRLVTPPRGEDAWVARFEAPEQVERGAPALLEAEVRSTRPGRVPYEVTRDGAVLYRGEVEIGPRGGRIRLVDRPQGAGAHAYTIRLRPVGDTAPGNDAAARWVEVRGAARVVLVTAYPTGPLAAALSGSGLEVDVLAEPRELSPGRLTGARVVVFEDVPASAVPRETIEALPFYVEAQGGGLLMVGGKSSFGSGGYFESAIDPLLPVSMELREEHRKLSVALGIVLDRSGSMAMTAAGAGGAATKMELANDAAARAVELLGARDQVAVLAVDSRAHVVVPRVALSSARAEVLGALRRIDSRGGGIFVYEGLSAAWRELEPADVGQRHVILFSDAADSEEPGDYVGLLSRMRAADATVSVIGLGRREDADGALLEDIAERGGGRVFFTESAAELPALFAQETVAVARSVFVEDPVGVRETAGWLELAGRSIDWPSFVDAYNLTYPREGATVAACGMDAEAAPLVAFWRRGRGRSAAVTYPLAGTGSAAARAWPGYGDFVATLARWLAGDGVPPGVALMRRREGSTLHLELRHDARWDARLARSAPRLAVVRDAPGVRGEVAHVPWARVGPGRWSARLELPQQGFLRGVVQVGEADLAFGPVHAPVGLEWRKDEGAKASLLALSSATGGARRTRLADVWRAPRPARYGDVSGWFVALGLLLVVIDAFVERAGWRSPELRWPRSGRTARRVRPGQAGNTRAPEAEPELDSAAREAERRRRRLARAKARR